MARRQIGGISANIAGDYRYTQIFRLFLEEDRSVTLEVWGTSPIGGMDGSGGVHWDEPEFKAKTCPNATARDVGLLIRGVLKDKVHGGIIRSYGKPTKNFEWYNHKGRGISMRVIEEVLKEQA